MSAKKEIGAVGAKTILSGWYGAACEIIIGIRGVAGSVFVGMKRGYTGYMHEERLSIGFKCCDSGLYDDETWFGIYEEVGEDWKKSWEVADLMMWICVLEYGKKDISRVWLYVEVISYMNLGTRGWRYEGKSAQISGRDRIYAQPLDWHIEKWRSSV